MAEEKYVLKHEYEVDKGKIYKRINEEKTDTNARISDLDKLTHVFIESQKPIAKGFEKMDEQLEKLNKTMSSSHETIIDHGRRIESIEKNVTSREKHNTTIWGYVIAGIFGLLTTALGLAQFLF